MTTQHPQPEIKTSWRSPAAYALPWIMIASVGAIAFFWTGLVSLIDAWARPEYSYGPLVPLITSYMILREIHHHPLTEIDDSRLPGVLTIAAGLLLGFVGNISNIPDIITYGFILLIGGFMLILAGWRQGLRFWPGWVHLIFMLPLPNFIYWPLSIKLQSISSILGVEFIYLLDIPVYLDGNIIDLGVYKLQVAEACNGLRYLFPLMSFGWLFAVLYNGPMWHKVILFLSTIPITILMNSFRIGVIGLLVNQFGISQAEGFLHFFEGWVIFMTCIVMLFLEAWLLQQLVPVPRPLRNVIDIDIEGLITPLSKAANIHANQPLVFATVLLILAAATWQFSPSRASVVVDRQSLGAFPMRIDDWRGTRQALDPTIERVLGADDYLVTDYFRSEPKDRVNLFVSYYRSQTSGSGIHSPEVCIPSGGWEVSRWRTENVSFSKDASASFEVNRAIIQKGYERQLVYYWFDQRGRKLTSDYWAKLYTVWDSIIHARSDGALVRVVTPIKSGEADTVADARLEQFIQNIYGRLEDYVPN